MNSAPYFNFDEGDGFLTTRTVAENTPVGENIGDALRATDDDAGDDLTFALGQSRMLNPDAASFDIDADTGQLKTKAALDYETPPRMYTVRVTVSDGKGETADADALTPRS